MKKHVCGVLCLCFLLLMCLSGCGPTLKEYVSQSNSYASQLVTAGSPKVTIGNKAVVKSDGNGVMGAIASTVNTVNSVAGYAVSRDQEGRIRHLVRPSEIATIMGSGFNDNFIDKTHLVCVEPSARPDIRVFLSIEDYGLYAESMLSTMNFYVEAEIQMVHTSSMETIYQNHLAVEREAKSVVSEIMNLSSDVVRSLIASHPFMIRVAGLREKLSVVENVVSIASGVASMEAFFELTDDDIVVIFEYMAYDAGQAMSMRLVNEIYR